MSMTVGLRSDSRDSWRAGKDREVRKVRKMER